MLDGDGDLTTIQSSLDPNGRHQILAAYNRDTASQAGNLLPNHQNNPTEEDIEYAPLELPSVPVFGFSNENSSKNFPEISEEPINSQSEISQKRIRTEIKSEKEKKSEKKEVLSANEKIIYEVFDGNRNPDNVRTIQKK